MKREKIFIAALAAVAWADDALHRREVVFFRQALEELALAPEDEREALHFILSPLPVASIPIATLGAADQERLLAFAYLMARADKTIYSDELRVIRALADAAGLSWERAQVVFDHAAELAGVQLKSGPISE